MYKGSLKRKWPDKSTTSYAIQLRMQVLLTFPLLHLLAGVDDVGALDVGQYVRLQEVTLLLIQGFIQDKGGKSVLFISKNLALWGFDYAEGL